jgi:hypothetical protein
MITAYLNNERLICIDFLMFNAFLLALSLFLTVWAEIKKLFRWLTYSGNLL